MKAPDTKMITLIAMLAAVYAVGSFLPGFPMIGVSDSDIDFVRSLDIGYGIILGPVYGPITAFIGAVIGKVLTGGGFGMFLTPLAPVSAFIAACLTRRVVFKVHGWMLSSGLFALLILAWYGTTTGRAVPFFPVFHILALGIIIFYRGKIVDFINNSEQETVSIGVALSSFPSTMAGHMLGNLIYILILKPEPLVFVGLLPITFSERVVITILSMVITTPLLPIIKNMYPDLVEKS